MVAAPPGDLYTSFPRGPQIEEGFQSSEEGSDLHSPIIEVPYPPPDVRYHLGHLTLPGVTTSLVPPPYDARYPIHDLSIQIPDPHILETLQVPSSTTIHYDPIPHNTHPDYGLQQHSILHMGSQSGRLQLPALSPPSEFNFNIPQTRLSEPQLNVSHVLPSPTTSRTTNTMPSTSGDRKQQQITTSGKGTASGAGSNAGSTRPPRREASTTVIACRQCRARKIRCDSTRPFCNNCTRRNNECEYDSAPKRRGPDKRPGTRQRSCKKRPPESEVSGSLAKKRRKTNGDHDGSLISFDVKENSTNKKPPPMSRFVREDMSGVQIPQTVPLTLETSISHRDVPSDAIYPKDELSAISRRLPLYMYDTMDPSLNHSYPRPVEVNVSRPRHEDQGHRDIISVSPAFDYIRRTFWDNLLDTYSATREQSMSDIFNDLEFLVNHSSYWLFFLNVPVFFEELNNSQQRSRMQPSLIFSALALSTLMKSSEMELGDAGRRRALFLRDTAQSQLESACNSQAVDYQLAEAALILAVFESSCHPLYSIERANSSLQFLDQIARTLYLPFTDLNDPDASVFTPRAIPTVDLGKGYITPERCSCIGQPTSPITSTTPNHYELSFSFNPPWDPNWTIQEVRKEECRRICWSALTLVANYTSQCAAFHQEPLELYLAEPSNFALLFPGEAYERSAGHQIPGQSPKESVWALYCRSMLLWNSCTRKQDDTWTTEERAEFAIDAWRETQAVQDALDMHQCNSDTALMYMCREFLYNTRMTITYELRRLQDLENVGPTMFNRRQAEEWLYYQDQVAKRVKHSILQLDQAPGHLLSRRPFQVTWFSSQVAICLALWNYDRSLVRALELAKAFLIPLDTLNALWPCPAQRARRDELRQRLEEACHSAGIQTPLPVQMSLPPIPRPNI